MSTDDPVVLFERATARAATVMAGVSAGQLGVRRRVPSGTCSN